jgi:hypothetical protein
MASAVKRRKETSFFFLRVFKRLAEQHNCKAAETKQNKTKRLCSNFHYIATWLLVALETRILLDSLDYIWCLIFCGGQYYITTCLPIFSIHDLTCPPRGLPPYPGEEVCKPQWPGELCWWVRKLLVEPPMPDRWKRRGQTKCSPWCSRLGVWHGTNNPIPEKYTVTKPWRRPRPMWGCCASKEEDLTNGSITSGIPQLKVYWTTSINTLYSQLRQLTWDNAFKKETSQRRIIVHVCFILLL